MTTNTPTNTNNVEFPFIHKYFLKDLRNVYHELYQVVFLDDDGAVDVVYVNSEEEAEEFIKELKGVSIFIIKTITKFCWGKRYIHNG